MSTLTNNEKHYFNIFVMNYSLKFYNETWRNVDFVGWSTVRLGNCFQLVSKDPVFAEYETANFL